MKTRGFMDDRASAKTTATGEKMLRFALRLAAEIAPDASAEEIAAPNNAAELGFLIGQCVLCARDDDLVVQIGLMLGLSMAIGGVVGSLPIGSQADLMKSVRERLDAGQIGVIRANGSPNA